MKRFIRTVAGKTVLFISCVLCVVLLAVSIVGAFFMMGRSYYTSAKSTVFEQLARNEINSAAYRVIAKHFDRGIDIGFENSNVLYILRDINGKEIEKSTDYSESETNTYTQVFGVLKENGKVTDIFFHYDYYEYDDTAEYYAVEIQFRKGFPKTDVFSFIYGFVNVTYAMRYAVYFLAVLTLAGAITSFITLMCVSARRPDSDALHPGHLNKVPFDILIAICAFIIALLVCICGCLDLFVDNFTAGIVVISLCFVALNIFIGLCMSIAARLKQQTLIKNTVICRLFMLTAKIFRGIGRFIMSIPLVWRTACAILAVTVIEFITIVMTYYETDVMMVYWVIEKIILSALILYIAIMIKRLFDLGKALARGETERKIDTKGLIFDFKRHGENLNDVANGISIAVDEKLKSERFKTELITNVSHDIKTPLTSVINYSTLIGTEKCDNPKITEYASVLVRQSERLKRLIDDLVEASKASSGNLDVRAERLDGTIFITQSCGEYAEKLESRELTLITKCPETPTWIMADGRRMWRIFDNLLNNVVKYAQSGTRVYITLETTKDSAVFTFKNTSATELDITEEELMERFVRGDKSRTADGNGLGLSIAKSLAELQGGRLDISIDGDLFKATLTFPKQKEVI